MVDVSIVLPCYNEAAHLARTIREVQTLPFEHEILVVDDGSTDDSREIAQQIEGVELIALPHNHGKGHALSAGIHRARGRAIAFLDGDGEVSPTSFVDLIPRVLQDKAQFVSGARFPQFHPASPEAGAMVWMLATLLGLSSGYRGADPVTGMNLFSADVARQLVFDTSGFGIEVSMQRQASQMDIIKGEYLVDSYTPRTVEASKKLQIRDIMGIVLRTFGFSAPEPTEGRFTLPERASFLVHLTLSMREPAELPDVEPLSLTMTGHYDGPEDLRARASLLFARKALSQAIMRHGGRTVIHGIRGAAPIVIEHTGARFPRADAEGTVIDLCADTDLLPGALLQRFIDPVPRWDREGETWIHTTPAAAARAQLEFDRPVPPVPRGDITRRVWADDNDVLRRFIVDAVADLPDGSGVRASVACDVLGHSSPPDHSKL